MAEDETLYEKRKRTWLQKNEVASVKPLLPRPNGSAFSVTPHEPLPKMLVGWKQIADYLGVPQNVAVRWHKEYGMPVIRIAAKRVFVHRDALVEWFFRLDKMQRKFIDETMEKVAPGGKVNPRRGWLNYIREKGRVRPDDPESASLRSGSQPH